jgi:membrane associated rhomboid family serine protease
MATRSVLGSAILPLRLVFIMWLLFFLYLRLGWPIQQFGIVPRTVRGLIGIVAGPLLHENIIHLVSNTIPLLFLGGVLFYFYPSLGKKVFLRGYFWTNILVWIFARPATHLGASGLVYALAFFLIFFGFFKHDFTSLVISVVILLLYGGLFYGVIPGDPHVSWESHFAGALVGIFSAVSYSSSDRS